MSNRSLSVWTVLTAAAVMMMTLSPVPAGAVWEHAPISADTRLPGGSAVWELGMIYTPEALFPAVLSCPAGFRAVLHFQNLSSLTLALKFQNPVRTVIVPPGAYRRIDLGVQAAGEHVFALTTAESNHSGHAREELPLYMRCQLLTAAWPQSSDTVYRTAWIVHSRELLPHTLLLPSGRDCEVAVGGPSAQPPLAWQAAGRNFEFKPGALTVAELLAPRGGVAPVNLPGKAPAELSIR